MTRTKIRTMTASPTAPRISDFLRSRVGAGLAASDIDAPLVGRAPRRSSRLLAPDAGMLHADSGGRRADATTAAGRRAYGLRGRPRPARGHLRRVGRGRLRAGALRGAARPAGRGADGPARLARAPRFAARRRRRP